MTVHETNEAITGAAETLRRVDDVRRGTRRMLNVAWFPMLLWGTIVLVSAPISMASDAVTGIYWLLAASAGLLVTIRFFRRHGFEHGLEPRHRKLYPGVGVAIALTCFALGAAGGEMVSAVGPIYAVAVGMLAFAALGRVGIFAYASAALVAAATLIVIAHPGDPIVVAALVEGSLLLVAGFSILIVEQLRGPQGDSRMQAG